MLYSPVRYYVSSSVLLLQKYVVQLACVKHAASVRPEPGSNSQLISLTLLIAYALYSFIKFHGCPEGQRRVIYHGIFKKAIPFLKQHGGFVYCIETRRAMRKMGICRTKRKNRLAKNEEKVSSLDWLLSSSCFSWFSCWRQSALPAP